MLLVQFIAKNDILSSAVIVTPVVVIELIVDLMAALLKPLSWL